MLSATSLSRVLLLVVATKDGELTALSLKVKLDCRTYGLMTVTATAARHAGDENDLKNLLYMVHQRRQKNIGVRDSSNGYSRIDENNSR